MTTETEISFADLGLSAPILSALGDMAMKSLLLFNNNVFLTC